MNVRIEAPSFCPFPPDNHGMPSRMAETVAFLASCEDVNDMMPREHDDEGHDYLGFTRAGQGYSIPRLH
jgi:hypothetical protein